jgi:NADH-quinone oxidoreductase subunit C
MSKKVLEALSGNTGPGPHAIVRTASVHTDDVAWVKREHLLEVAKWLRDDPAMLFDAPVFVTCIDWLDWRPAGRPESESWAEGKPRFTVCYQLRSTVHKHRLRLEIELLENDPRLPSLATTWSAFNWQERETFDMYGIQFDGHPDLRRIYLYEEFVGYPLRKDYPKEKRQPLARRDDLPTVIPEAKR